MLAGDYEEHAILLCNYFRFLDKMYRDQSGQTQNYDSMIVLGRGVPEGKTYYVLRRDTTDKQNDKNELWNPVTGDVYTFSLHKLTPKFLCFRLNAGTVQESGGRFGFDCRNRLNMSFEVRRRHRY